MKHLNERISFTKLKEEDLGLFVQVIKLFEEVFEKEPFQIPDPSHLKRLLSDNDFFVFVAMNDKRVIGALTGYILDQYYSEKPLAYIYDLAVDTGYQRSGLGTKLVAAINDYCRLNGIEEVFVQAEKVDDHALAFYRSTQPTREEQVVHFSYTSEPSTPDISGESQPGQTI